MDLRSGGSKGGGSKGGRPKGGRPAFKNTTKIQREDTQRGKKRTKFWAVPGRAVPRKGGSPEGRFPGRAVPRKGGSGGTEHDQNLETNTHVKPHTMKP